MMVHYNLYFSLLVYVYISIKLQCFRSWSIFHLQVKRERTEILAVGPPGFASLRPGLFLTENRKIQLPKCNFIEMKMLDKVQKKTFTDYSGECPSIYVFMG
jgi:hypothetical protein